MKMKMKVFKNLKLFRISKFKTTHRKRTFLSGTSIQRKVKLKARKKSHGNLILI
jgi:hypothetical protein